MNAYQGQQWPLIYNSMLNVVVNHAQLRKDLIFLIAWVGLNCSIGSIKTISFANFLGLWDTWGEGLDVKECEWWMRTMGSCLSVARSSTFAKREEGPYIVEKGIFMSLGIITSIYTFLLNW